MKANRWIGICTDILDKNWYVNGFVLADFPWEKDAEMEKAMKTFVFEKWKTES